MPRISKSDVVFLVVVVLLALAIRFGVEYALATPYPFVVVQGNSMLPLFTSGDLVILIGLKHAGLPRPGDVVVYYSCTYRHYIVHRVVDVINTSRGIYFMIKGDNNPIPDTFEDRSANCLAPAPGVPLARVVGRVVEVPLPSVDHLPRKAVLKVPLIGELALLLRDMLVGFTHLAP